MPPIAVSCAAALLVIVSHGCDDGPLFGSPEPDEEVEALHDLALELAVEVAPRDQGRALADLAQAFRETEREDRLEQAWWRTQLAVAEGSPARAAVARLAGDEDAARAELEHLREALEAGRYQQEMGLLMWLSYCWERCHLELPGTPLGAIVRGPRPEATCGEMFAEMAAKAGGDGGLQAVPAHGDRAWRARAMAHNAALEARESARDAAWAWVDAATAEVDGVDGIALVTTVRASLARARWLLGDRDGARAELDTIIHPDYAAAAAVALARTALGEPPPNLGWY